jgi:hypothetical protein
VSGFSLSLSDLCRGIHKPELRNWWEPAGSFQKLTWKALVSGDVVYFLLFYALFKTQNIFWRSSETEEDAVLYCCL